MPEPADKSSVKEKNIEGHPIVPIRMKESEKCAFIAASRKDGFRSLGTWLKHLARQRVLQLEAMTDDDHVNPN